MTDAWTTWPAPAKLNLFLHIVGRRADGYHLLQTAFQLLDWGDTLRLRTRDDGVVTRLAGLDGVEPDDDLAVRAALALQTVTGRAFGADIIVEKRIPVGGGLGGGSSDAATVLVALNELWECGLALDQLAQIGLTLGADVPVFVHGRSAWAEGVGEVLAPIDLPPRWFAIVDPGVAVPTRELFQLPELTRDTPPTTIPRFLAGMETANVFAPVVRARFTQVAAALNWLGQFGDARLSGSGGCGFVAVESSGKADAIVSQCPPQFRAWTARGVNRSPLHEALEKHHQD
ncbi:MAG: 4-(cytidine 5'-diphospho)-2-C-methyl-D-erythritol kinase [Xanthomonadaceae bacterium]|nr:4-(cytidine 5'-diphospho)-2-C-methyl-D-erythritol kinase [Xanthomonadaceae bacterium]MDE1960301.1 4-(cytidine 5'-diphospho)-2-C-methyl-D-erythritol kinase [Xanthomonadaceae bacterium]